MTIEVGAGGGGLLKLVAFDSDRLDTGLSGGILSVTAGAGQYLRLTHLVSDTSLRESGMTLTIDGNDIFTNELLASESPDAPAASNVFGVSNGYGDTSADLSARILQNVQCTSFIVTKVSGTTTQKINYAYETLEKIT
tara:strand:+ start:2972 stop:3385 length:414 start_codon:yes stop_codon:yes gene_type:complete